MKITKGGIIFVIMFVCLFVDIGFVDAYDTNIGHRKIVDRAVALYNSKSDTKVTAKQAEWIAEGVMLEDTPIRWMNHFYDPVSNKGLSGFLSAKKWSKSSFEQSNYVHGDNSWNQAVSMYQKGNEKESFIALGHVLHLIADVSVPAHSRLDTHVLGDSYEQYVKKNWYNVSFNSVYDDLINKKYALGDVFDIVASYSNNFFYSDDSIESSKYPIISIKEFKNLNLSNGDIGLFAVSGFNGSLLYMTEPSFDWKKPFEPKKTLNSSLILSDYSKTLVPKAVDYSALVINIFFHEVNNTEYNQSSNSSLIGKLQDSFFSLFTGIKSMIGIDDTEESLAFENPLTNLENINNGTEYNDELYKIIELDNAENSMNSIVVHEDSMNFLEDEIISLSEYENSSNEDISNDVVINSEKDLFEDIPVVTSYTEIEYDLLNVTSTIQDEDEEYTSVIDTDDESDYLSISLSKPKVTSHSNIKKYVVTSTYVNVSGIVDSNAKYLDVYYSITDDINRDDYNLIDSINCTGEIWSYDAYLEIGDNFIYFIARNSNTSSKYYAPLKFLREEVLPVPKLLVKNVSTTISINILNQEIYRTDLSYDLQYSTNGNSWYYLSRATTTLLHSKNGVLGRKYLFRVRSRNSLDTYSVWSDVYSLELPPSKTVLIDRVSFIKEDDKYVIKWIELLGNGKSSTNIEKWKFIIGSNEISFSNALQKKIKPNEKYLLVFNDPSFLSVASYYIENTIELVNSSIIQLLNGRDEIVDKIDLNNITSSEYIVSDVVDEDEEDNINSVSEDIISTSTPETNDIVSSTEQVIDIVTTTDTNIDEDDNYVTSTQITDPFIIDDSTNISNSNLISLDGNQIEDIRYLKKEYSPYILKYYNIPKGKKLIIEAGVVIKSYYNNSYIQVEGGLDASGLMDDEIVMTSGRDQRMSGRNNLIVGQWDESEMVMDWQGIWFKSGSVGKLDNLVIRDGGRKFKIDKYQSNQYSEVIRIDNAEVDILNTIIDGGGEYLISIYNSTTTIDNVDLINSNKAMMVDGGSNTIGKVNLINILSEESVIDFMKGWDYLAEVNFGNNVEPRIYYKDVSVINLKVTLDPRIQYLFSVITIDSSSTLNIPAGTNIIFNDYGLMKVNGKLNVNGVVDKPVIIGGDKNWGYISINGGQAVLSNTIINGGGYLVKEADTVFLLNNADFDCRNCIFKNSRVPGNTIKLYASNLSLVDCTLEVDIKWPDPTSWYSSYSNAIRAFGGIVFLDNVNIIGYNYGIFKSPYNDIQTELITQNMSVLNFINVYKSYIW